MPPRPQWTPEEATDWYAAQPWPAGCNFIPSTAVNQIEMWEEASFDPATIERELGWAAGIGFNAVRVYLHDIPWRDDPAGFMERMERFLGMAASHGVRTLFVLFDGVWDPHPRPGQQPPPRPHVHNPGWAQSPGAAILGDGARHDELESYVSGVITRFANDGRILGWDLFNEPDNPNLAYRASEIANKGEMALALLGKTYGWARAAGPSQPLTSGVWRPEWVQTGGLSEVDEFQLSESDVISFHCYTSPLLLRERIAELERYGQAHPAHGVPRAPVREHVRFDPSDCEGAPDRRVQLGLRRGQDADAVPVGLVGAELRCGARPVVPRRLATGRRAIRRV